MTSRLESYALVSDDRVPNSDLPLLVYREVFEGRVPAFEDRLRRNGWPPDWHSALGMFPHHHFHSDSHELIAVTRGRLAGTFGGNGGVSVVLEQGDVVVIPAGVGHIGTEISADLRLTGCFPAGFGVHDFRLGYAEERDEMVARMRQVPVPTRDPIFGSYGPLPDIWSSARGRRDSAPNTTEINLERWGCSPNDASPHESRGGAQVGGAELSPMIDDDFGYAPKSASSPVKSGEVIGDLLKLRTYLIKRRRYIVQDAMAYPFGFRDRARDLANIHPLIVSVENALTHERRLLANQHEAAEGSFDTPHTGT